MTVDNLTPSLDGWVGRINVNEASFDALRSGAGNDVNDTSNGLNVLMGANVSANWDDMRRSVILFDLSAVAPTERVRVPTTLRLDPAVLPSDGFGGQAVVLVQSNPASDLGLVAADYNFANFAMGSPLSDVISLSGITPLPFDFTLNDAGIAYLQSVVDAGGIAKFGIVYEADRANTPPTLGSNLSANLNLDSSETAQPPTLSLMHVPKSTPGIAENAAALAYNLAQGCVGLPVNAFALQSIELSLARLLYCLQGRPRPSVGQSAEASLDGIFAELALERPRRATLTQQLATIEANLP